MVTSFDSTSSDLFRIGIGVEKVSGSLATHLKLTGERPIIITQVHPDEPAKKAGLKKHDILRSVAGKLRTIEVAPAKSAKEYRIVTRQYSAAALLSVASRSAAQTAIAIDGPTRGP